MVSIVLKLLYLLKSTKEKGGKMKKSELKTHKDSQGFYEVTYHGRTVWEGFAANASEAKSLAIEWNDR